MKYTHKWTLNRSRFVFGVNAFAKFLKGHGDLLYSTGVHFIHGAGGSGKSLLMNIILNELLKNGGFVWCSLDEFDHDRVRYFDVNSMFKDGKQQFRLNKFLTINGKTEKCVALIVEELNYQFNRRLNKTADYNNTFIPFMSYLVTSRHRLTDRVYMIGQSLLLQDGQIPTIVKVRHDVRSKKGWWYQFWREDLKMIFAPKQLKVTHYVNNGCSPDGNVTWAKIKKPSKIDVTYRDLTTYRTHAMEFDDDGLPKYINDDGNAPKTAA